MTSSPNLDLPFLLPSQAMKHITHNEALLALDTLVQLAVLDRDLAAPPSDPEEGDRYLVAAGASGAWTGKSTQIAAFAAGGWAFHAPRIGWQCFVADEATMLVWTGADWEVVVGADGSLDMLGINTMADPVNRLAVKADAVLLAHDDVTPGSGDLRLLLDKATSGDTASLLLQTGASGRAEIGTTSDDLLHVKVSADGSSWTEALLIDAGGVSVMGPLRLGLYTVSGLPAATGRAGALVYVSDESGGAVPAFSDGSAWRRITDRAPVS